jgi:ATP-dependent Clp protease ATP-binding subunit ClpC
MTSPTFSRWTDRSRRAISIAQDHARQDGRAYVSSAYLLMGILAEAETLGYQALRSLGVTLESTRFKLLTLGPPDRCAPTAFIPPFTTELAKVCERAEHVAARRATPYVATEHLLLAMIEYEEENSVPGEGAPSGMALLYRLNVTNSSLRKAIDNILMAASAPSEDDIIPEEPVASEREELRYCTIPEWLRQIDERLARIERRLGLEKED